MNGNERKTHSLQKPGTQSMVDKHEKSKIYYKIEAQDYSSDALETRTILLWWIYNWKWFCLCALFNVHGFNVKSKRAQ